jgi:hypothetical protein
VSEFVGAGARTAASVPALRFRDLFGVAARGLVDLDGLYADLRPLLRRFVPWFELIHADIAAKLVFASSGMMRPFPCAIFFAYNNCAGLTGLGPSFPAVSPSALLGACSLRNLRQIEIEVL